LLFRKAERDDVKHEQNAVVNGETFHFGAECALHRDRVYSYKLKNFEPQVFIFEYLLMTTLDHVLSGFIITGHYSLCTKQCVLNIRNEQ